MRSYVEALRALGFSDFYDKRSTHSNGSPNHHAVLAVTIEYLMANGPQFYRFFKKEIMQRFDFKGRNSRADSYFKFPENGEIQSTHFGDLYAEYFYSNAPRHGVSAVLYLPEHKGEKLRKFLETAAKTQRAQSQSFTLK